MFVVAVAGSSGLSTPLPPRISESALSRSFGRCEPWSPDRATLLEVINVVGRFRDSSAWSDRTSPFATVDDASASTADQAATAKRRAFADKMSQVERLAFVENVPQLPFEDESLAATAGLSVKAFAAMTVEPAHLAVVFDSLARSKTTLVDRSQADERIASWRRDDGSFDVDAFSSGLRKGSVAVLAANAVLYFFLTAGAAVVARVVLGAASGGGSG